MDYLFQTTTTNTYEEYKRFNTKLMFFTKTSLIMYILLAIILILSGLLGDTLSIIIWGLAVPLFLWFLNNIQTKRLFSSNKSFQNMLILYTFYDTCFVLKNESGMTKLEYTKLHKIIETKTNFYLMVSKNQGYILTKSEFPDGLSAFLRDVKAKNAL